MDPSTFTITAVPRKMYFYIKNNGLTTLTSGPFTTLIEWAGQRLPNELLLMIMEHLHGDRRNLYILLFVNRFFFKACAPLLYADPFKDLEPTPAFEKLDEWDDHDYQDCQCNTFGMQQRLSLLFLHCYPEAFTTVEFFVCIAHRFLPMANMLPKLATLILHRGWVYRMPETHLENTVAFIVMNRMAFPAKQPLQLRFLSEWEDWESKTDRYNLRDGSQDGSEYSSVFSMNDDEEDDSEDEDHLTCQERRELDRQYQLPRIALYKAVGHPAEMDVSLHPCFYQDVVDSFEMDALERLVDMDRDRHRFGESPDRKAFLQRCKNYRALEIHVDHPDFFSYATTWNRRGTTLDQPQTPFNKLQELTIRTWGQFDALGDAMLAFGQTVATVRINNGGYRDHNHTDL
ncbi:hypothetical protein BG006_000275 [Podila minutissima]|uniref:F-box domain-containing protein n=1 Tax=Podila minutissima TaxID=64525 RepID=A0A9P5VHS8_9FUNG|nr:hypothetical protein BG006_000275 [Podila minutissima]